MAFTEDDVLSAVHRSKQAYHDQISEKQTLSCGIAYRSTDYPRLFECNHLREVILPTQGTLAEFWDEVQSFYAEHELTCYRWTPAIGSPIEPLEAFLAERGFGAQRHATMVLNHDVDLPVREDIRVLPGRPMRKAIHDLRMTDARFDEDTRAMLAESRNERMDDPQYDMFVAMQDKTPVASGVLMQVGDIGAIENVFVAEHARRQGVGLALMGELLALARRLALRIIVLETEIDNHAAIALYERCGFSVAGSYVDFVAPETQK